MTLSKLTEPDFVSSAGVVPTAKTIPGSSDGISQPALTRQQEASRAEVLARLAANPAVPRVFVTRFENGLLIVTLAVRGLGTCELMIAPDRFNEKNLDEFDALLGCLDVPST